ncbi:MAG: DUF3343 domain-containing protein [Clostridiales bacterium]|nr:DUF3343 domain-containing protein [Clostridiales bacterium]
MQEYYLFTFESTHAAISTEKLLKPAECAIMPVPRFISSSCGISVRIRPDKRKEAEKLFKSGSKLTSADYKYYHIQIGDTGEEIICNQISV